MNALRSPLGRLAGPSPLTAIELEAALRALWHREGKIIAGIDDQDLKPEQRSVIERIGRDRFGER
jgi:hypothetical protein